MIPVPSGVRVWLATGPTDMRRGVNGLAIQVQETLRRDPHGGHLLSFAASVATARHSASFPYIPGNLSVLTSCKAVKFLGRRAVTSRTPA